MHIVSVLKIFSVLVPVRVLLISIISVSVWVSVTGISQAQYAYNIRKYVCPHDNSQTNDPKVFKLGKRNDLWISYKSYDFGVERSKVRDSGSQSAKTYLRRSSGSMSYAIYPVPASSCICILYMHVQCTVLPFGVIKNKNKHNRCNWASHSLRM